jgi:hypothetical protein
MVAAPRREGSVANEHVLFARFPSHHKEGNTNKLLTATLGQRCPSTAHPRSRLRTRARTGLPGQARRHQGSRTATPTGASGRHRLG